MSLLSDFTFQLCALASNTRSHQDSDFVAWDFQELIVVKMIRNGETHPDVHCVALSLRAPCVEVVAEASNSHDGLRIEVLEKEKAAMQKVLFEQGHEISILVKQVDFFRQGFASYSSMFDTGHYDAVAVFEKPYPSKMYSRPVHRCILESKSRVIKTKWQIMESRTDNGIKKLELPELQNMSKKASKSFLSDYVYDAFVEFFYQASVPTSALEHYWTWLLFLGTEYEVAALKEECEQYFKGNVDINGTNIVDILELRLTCGAQLLIRSAMDAHARFHILNMREERCRKLLEKYPHARNLISQAERLHMGRQFPE